MTELVVELIKTKQKKSDLTEDVEVEKVKETFTVYVDRWWKKIGIDTS